MANAKISGYELLVVLDGTEYKVELRDGFKGFDIPAACYAQLDGTFCVTCGGRKIPVLHVQKVNS